MELQPRPHSLDQALEWHSAITDSVSNHRDAELAAMRRGAPPIVPRLVGLTIDEIWEIFRDEQSEVDAAAVVPIIAAAEAALRADFRARVRQRRKDALSQAYLSHYATLSASKRRRPDFDRGGILDAMKSAAVIADHLLTAFRRTLHLRHWHAHGRYWLLKTNAAGDPLDAHAVGTALITSVAAI